LYDNPIWKKKKKRGKEEKGGKGKKKAESVLPIFCLKRGKKRGGGREKEVRLARSILPIANPFAVERGEKKERKEEGRRKYLLKDFKTSETWGRGGEKKKENEKEKKGEKGQKSNYARFLCIYLGGKRRGEKR